MGSARTRSVRRRRESPVNTPIDPRHALEQLPDATLRVLECRWDENRLADAQCMLMHRLRCKLGDETALLVDRIWREVPPIPHGDLIDVEPTLSAAAAYGLRHFRATDGRPAGRTCVEVVCS